MNERTNQYRKAFSATLDAYHAVKTVSRSSSVSAFYAVLANGTHGSRCPNETLPSVLDYLADVELAAKAVMSFPDYVDFKSRFFEQYPEDGHEKTWDRQRDAVGRELIERGIFPTTRYLFLHSNHQQRQCKCGDKSHKAANSAESVWCQTCDTNLLFHAVGRTETLPSFSRYWCSDCAARLYNQGWTNGKAA